MTFKEGGDDWATWKSARMVLSFSFSVLYRCHDRHMKYERRFSASANCWFCLIVISFRVDGEGGHVNWFFLFPITLCQSIFRIFRYCRQGMSFNLLALQLVLWFLYLLLQFRKSRKPLYNFLVSSLSASFNSVMTASVACFLQTNYFTLWHTTF